MKKNSIKSLISCVAFIMVKNIETMQKPWYIIMGPLNVEQQHLMQEEYEDYLQSPMNEPVQ